MISFFFTCWGYIAALTLILSNRCKLKIDYGKNLVYSVVTAIIIAFLMYYYPNIYTKIVMIFLELLLFKTILPLTTFHTLCTTLFLEINILTSECLVGTIFTVFIPNHEINNWFILFLCFLFSAFFDFLFSSIFHQILNKKIPRYSWVLLILPFITLFFALNITEYFFNANSPFMISAVLFGLVISNFVMLFLYIKSIQSMKLQSEITLLNQKDKLFQEKIKMLDQNYHLNFNFLHELLHQCNLLNVYEKINDKENLHKMIQTISSSTSKAFNIIYTNAPALNAVINHFLDDIRKDQIDIETSVFCDLSSIAYTDQVLLFYSLLDFSIHSIKQNQKPKKVIHISCKEIHSKSAVKIEFIPPKDPIGSYQLPNKIQEKYDPYTKIDIKENSYTILTVI